MRLAAYCRVSTSSDEQLDSLNNQKSFFNEYAERNGHKLVKLYADEGLSGTSLKNRKAFLQLMQDAKIGLFEQIVVKDVSRFARNTVDFLQSIRQLKSYGVNILFLTANMESMGESEFVLTMFSALAQEESANLSKRVKFGKKINAKKGRVPQRIFGYDRIDNFTLEINFDEAKVVRDIYRLYLDQGLGCRTISLELNQLGHKTKFDCEWNPRGVRRVLTNSIYCGHYVNNKYEIKDYLTKTQSHVPSQEQFHHERPEWAIISPDLFQRAQEQMELRRTQYSNGEPFMGARYSSKHPFSTLIKCEHCGRSFCRKQYTYVNTRTYWKCTTNDQYTAEKCDNSVKLEEDEMLFALREYFASLIEERDRFVQEVLSAFEAEYRESSPDISVEEVERKRKQLLAKRGKYQEMYANDVITMAELKAKTASIAEELESLDGDLRSCKQLQAVKNDKKSLVALYMDEISRFLDLETVTNTDLRKIISHIYVNRDGKVQIFLKKLEDFYPTFFPLAN